MAKLIRLFKELFRDVALQWDRLCICTHPLRLHLPKRGVCRCVGCRCLGFESKANDK